VPSPGSTRQGFSGSDFLDGDEIMLDVKSLQVITPNELKSGDLAFFSINKKWGFVGALNGFAPVLFLDPTSDWRMCQANEVDGYALRVENWAIKVDPTAALKPYETDDTLLSITACDGGYGVFGVPPSGGHPIHMALAEGYQGSPIRAIFPSWRLVAKDGDHEVTLFEHGDSPPKQPATPLASN
jgi:hypothetical protein